MEYISISHIGKQDVSIDFYFSSGTVISWQNSVPLLTSVVRVLVWRRTDNKALLEPVMTQLNETHTHHMSSI